MIVEPWLIQYGDDGLPEYVCIRIRDRYPKIYNVLADSDDCCDFIKWNPRLKIHLLEFSSIQKFIRVWRKHGGWEEGGF